MESKTRSRSPLASASGGHSGRSSGRRSPFADRTNTVTSPSSSSAFTPKPKRKTQRKSNPSSAPETARISVHGEAKNDSSDKVRLASMLCTSPSESHDETDLWEVEPWTVYTRQTAAEKRESKGKAVAVSASCSTVKVLKNARDKLNGERDDDISKSCPVHIRKRQKGHLWKSDEDSNALEDYIKQQKSYFAEVDAFELPEEEVASGGESD